MCWVQTDKWYLYTHPNLKRKCISLGFKHCNRYKAKIKTCCKVLNCVLWNDPRLDFLEMSEKRVFKLVAQQWNWELQQPDSAIKKFLKSTLLKYGHTVDGNIFKKNLLSVDTHPQDHHNQDSEETYLSPLEVSTCPLGIPSSCLTPNNHQSGVLSLWFSLHFLEFL